jgi:hypothetical protein
VFTVTENKRFLAQGAIRTGLACAPFGSKMVPLGAAMRKVLMLAFGVFKTRQTFDPNWVSRQVQPTT